MFPEMVCVKSDQSRNSDRVTVLFMNSHPVTSSFETTIVFQPK